MMNGPHRNSSTSAPKGRRSSGSSATASAQSAATAPDVPNNDKSNENETEVLSKDDLRIQQLLSEGAYHLPGNQYWYQDWWQYFRNNHPLFAPCCQDRLHPISKGMRLVGVVGSVMFGLVLTNVMVLFFSLDEGGSGGGDDADTVVLELSTGGFVVVQNGTDVVYVDEQNEDEYANLISEYTSAQFSVGMIILWTVGSAIHALFDNTIWYATSCSCCIRHDADDHDNNDVGAASIWGKFCAAWSLWIKRNRGYCNVLIIIGVVGMTAAATLAVAIRAVVEGSDDESADADDADAAMKAWDNVTSTTTLASPLTDTSNYDFLKAYAIELALAWFAWFPLLETILFTGILSCGGRIQCLGGRPAELKAEREERQAREDGLQRRSHGGDIEDGTGVGTKSPKTKRSQGSATSKESTAQWLTNVDGNRGKASNKTAGAKKKPVAISADEKKPLATSASKKKKKPVATSAEKKKKTSIEVWE
jgi:hypothetical protein